MVVGDDFQSIYSFRHADIRNILDFERDFPDAEVVKLEQNYRSTQTILSAANALIERQPREPAEAAVDGDRGRRAGAALRAGRRARGGALGRRRGRAAGHRGGHEPRGDRGLLPDQRDEPGARGHAGALRAPLPGDRRDEVLRAGRDQGRRRLSQPARQPVRPDLLRPRRQLAAARDRQHEPGAAGLAREHDRPADLGGRRPRRGGARAGRGGDQGRLSLPRDDRGPARPRRDALGRRGSSSRCCTRPATSRRSRPSGRSRPRGGSRTCRS